MTATELRSAVSTLRALPFGGEVMDGAIQGLQAEIERVGAAVRAKPDPLLADFRDDLVGLRRTLEGAWDARLTDRLLLQIEPHIPSPGDMIARLSGEVREKVGAWWGAVMSRLGLGAVAAGLALLATLVIWIIVGLISYFAARAIRDTTSYLANRPASVVPAVPATTAVSLSALVVRGLVL